jgi:L-fuculose-phosphate aldolase
VSEVARAAVVAAARRLDELGLNYGRTGNVGLRVPGGLLVTPSGVPPDELTPEMVVELDGTGRPRPGQLVPTSEWQLHAGILAARPDVGGVVHTHSPEATAAACLRRPLPAVHYVVAKLGGPQVPCAPYATYGSAELAANVVQALGLGAACLMANHGAVTVAASLDVAVELAADVEWLAGVHRRALQLAAVVGDAALPVVLDDEEIERVAERLHGYGQPG